MNRAPIVTLRPDVTYLSPLGRRCRWVPSRGEHRQCSSFAVFIYLDHGLQAQRHSEASRWFEGFHLTPPNFRLLREVQA